VQDRRDYYIVKLNRIIIHNLWFLWCKLRTSLPSIINLVTRILHLLLFCISGITTALLSRVLRPCVDFWSRVDTKQKYIHVISGTLMCTLKQLYRCKIT